MADPKLSAKDWAEVYYALDYKITCIERGTFGATDTNVNVEVWLAQLKSIRDRIADNVTV